MDDPLDAYVFAVDATGGAVTSALALVSGGTARAVLPTSGDRELYVALSDTDASALLTKIATTVTISGLTTVSTHLAYGESSQNAPFPTHGTVSTHVGFSLLTAAPGSVVAVYEDALVIAGVIGAAMVTGTVNVLVEVTASTTGGVTGILDNVAAITGATEIARAQGPVSGGAGF